MEQEQVSCSELELYEASILWAEVEAQRSALPEDPSSLREILGPVFGLVRFLAMTVEELTSTLVQDNFLSPEESRRVFMSHGTCDSGLLPDGFCKVATSRNANEETFLVYGRSPDEAQPTSANWFEYPFNKKANAEWRTCHHTYCRCIGVQVPTQVKPVGGESDRYDEELTAYLFSHDRKEIVAKGHFKSQVEYESVVNIVFENDFALYESLQVKIIFHKSGRYPADLKHDHELLNFDKDERFEDIKCRFHHEKGFKFIYYTVYAPYLF